MLPHSGLADHLISSSVSSTDDNISYKSSVGDLTADISVRGTNYHPVLGCIVFILVLRNEAPPGKEVSLSLMPPAELDLEPLEVCLVLNNFKVRHFDLPNAFCRCESSNISLVVSDLHVKQSAGPTKWH